MDKKELKDLTREQLVEISEKYVVLAKEETKVDLVRKYMSIVERAVRMISEIDKKKPVDVNPLYKFGSYIDRPMVRGEVYEKYLDFCEAIGEVPLSRNEFYRKLRILGFKDKHRNNNEYFVPPRKLNMPQMTLEEQIKALSES